MAFTNKSFEIAGVADGCPSGWTFASHAQRDYAIFGTAAPWETYETGWSNDTYKFAFVGVPTDLTPAQFQTLLPAPKEVENFEEFWNTNHNYIYALAGASALFDTTPENYEDFEEEWSSNEGYVYTLTGTVGDFDTSPEAFEDFEEDWDSNQSYVYTFSGTAADFDSAIEAYEDFEEEWLPDWQMVTIL
jgi:hypothetical protein